MHQVTSLLTSEPDPHYTEVWSPGEGSRLQIIIWELPGNR